MNNAQKKNSAAKIKANNRYKNKTYKRIAIDIKPDQAEYIKNKARSLKLSIAQLIVNSVIAYDIASDPDNIPDNKDNEIE